MEAKAQQDDLIKNLLILVEKKDNSLSMLEYIKIKKWLGELDINTLDEYNKAILKEFFTNFALKISNKPYNEEKYLLSKNVFLYVTGIEVSKILKGIEKYFFNGTDILNSFEEGMNEIKKYIFGQDNVIDSFKQKIFANLFLIQNNNSKRPKSFIFAGNSSTGKTEVANLVGNAFYGKALKICMSNFTADNHITMLTGTSVGRKGCDEPTLIEKYMAEQKQDRYCIIFDEMEKAPTAVYKFLLELLDTGTLTLLNGNILNLKNSLIIFTTNIGTKKFHSKIGFSTGEKEELVNGNVASTDENSIIDGIQSFFSPEVMNRIGRDNIYIFNDLSLEDKKRVVEKKTMMCLDDFKELIQLKKVSIERLKEIKDEIMEKYGDKSVRELEKVVEDKIIEAISQNPS